MKFDEQDIRLGIMRGIVRYMEEGSYQEPAAELQAIATTLARKAVSMIPHQWEARGIRLLTEMVSLGVFCRAHHAQIEQLSPHEVVGVSDGFSKLLDSWCGWGCPEAEDDPLRVTKRMSRLRPRPTEVA